jgi:molybdate transport system substrate-binding protein
MIARLLRGIALALLLAAAIAPYARAAERGTVTVFAAASLTDALGKIGQAYEAAGHGRAVFNFAASSVLARQIEASGGADMFMSADTDWMDYLDSRGLLAPGTRTNLLGNRLVLIAPRDSTVSLTIGRGFDLAGALRGGRLAIADPDSVPAGKYGRTALTQLGVWNGVADRVVQAENVRVALAYVARGEAPLGIVYTTDALAEPKVRIVGTFPANTHLPIVYPAALTRDAGPGGAAFLRFLSGREATAIFRAAGFIILGTGAQP